MFKNLKQSLLLTLCLIIIFGLGFPVLIIGIGKLIPERSSGFPVTKDGKVIGFENIGQNFTDDSYFNGRPSAVDYNAASTGGSNKGPTNPEYLQQVQDRIDTFLVHNPGIKKEDIPSEMVTASGGGLDPHISVQGAYIQIPRISQIRGIPIEELKKLVDDNTEKPMLGMFGTTRVNVLKLNIALDDIKK